MSVVATLLSGGFYQNLDYADVLSRGREGLKTI